MQRQGIVTYLINLSFYLLSFLLHTAICVFFLTRNSPPTEKFLSPPVFQIVSPNNQKVEQKSSEPQKQVSRHQKDIPPPPKKPATTSSLPDIKQTTIIDTQINLASSQSSTTDSAFNSSVQSSISELNQTNIDTERIFTESEIGGKIVAIYRPVVPYPPQAKQLGISGRVKAILTIDQYGMVTSVKIKQSDHPLFNTTVQRTLLKWKFKPVYIGGVAVRVQAEQQIDFVLK